MADEFTKIAGGLLVHVRDLVNWGLDTGNTTPEKMKLTVAARQEAAVKLISSGMSHAQAAKVLGVNRSTISRDVHGAQKSSAKRTDKEAEIKAANAKLKLVKPTPTASLYGTIVIDPPWEMEKIKRDVRPNQVAMRKREGKASARLPVPAVRAARGRSSVPDLPRYEEARRALEALHNVDDIGVVRDKAIALEEYAKVIKDPELLERAVRIKLEAWRNVGRVLREMRKAGELVKDGQRPRSSSPGTPSPAGGSGR